MKKEKYIREIKKGTGKYFQVQIRYTDGAKTRYWTQLVNISDYATAYEAMHAAIKIRDDALIDLRSNRLVKHTPTVGELFQRTKDLFNITVTTWRRHTNAYDHSIKPYGNKQITLIKAADIQKTLNDSINTYSVDATERVYAVWRQIYRAAIMDGLMIPDLTAVVQMPKSKKPVMPKKDVMISEADFNRYIEYLQVSAKYVKDKKGSFRRNRIIYILLILWNTGMRPAEVLALEWSDIDLDERTISVTKAVGSTATARRQIVTTKTAASVRMVPISDQLETILLKMEQELPMEHPLYDYDGLPFGIDLLCTFIRRTSKACGIKFNMYMCRHSMVRSLREADVAPRIQQDILGHTSYTTTISYDRSSEDERRKAIDTRKLS